MSADNGLYVRQLDDDVEMFGVFYYSASDEDTPDSWYSYKNADQVYKTRTSAILGAHKMQQDQRTEYGVSVSSVLLNKIEGYRKLRVK